MKLFHQLESIFKLRINSNSEIIPYIKKLSEMGKFDEPRKVAAIALLLDRVGKLEDAIEAEKSLHEIVYDTTQLTEEATPTNNTPPLPEIGVNEVVTGEEITANKKIEQEINEEAAKREATFLQTTGSPMSGVADQVTDETVAENLPVEQTVPAVETPPTEPVQDAVQDTVQVETTPTETPTESTIEAPIDDNTVEEFTPENITDTPSSTTTT